MQYYLGIDPGRKGGLALIDEYKNLIYYEAMPMLKSGYNYERIYEMIDTLPETTKIIMELKQGVMDKSASPTTSFAFHCGVLLGLCYKRKPVIISPKIWKKEFEITREYKEARSDMKLRSIKAAEKQFRINLKKNEDGLAEALLLAEYGRKHKL